MKYNVIYQTEKQNIVLSKHKTKKAAEKKRDKEKQKDNFGKNGYNEYITILLKR